MRMVMSGGRRMSMRMVVSVRMASVMAVTAATRVIVGMVLMSAVVLLMIMTAS